MLALFIIRNYITGVDPNDKILNNEITQQEQLVLSQDRSQREQHQENRQWAELRDKIVNDMWVRYSGFV